MEWRRESVSLCEERFNVNVNVGQLIVNLEGGVLFFGCVSNSGEGIRVLTVN